MYCSMMANALLVKAISIANSYMNPVALAAIGWVRRFPTTNDPVWAGR